MEYIEKCVSCGSENLIGVEYAWDSPNNYDGISEWNCLDCKKRFGRWTNKELIGDEEEKRYGGN
jgi:DNA-directed RNA polymerase subunit RPC12/RpoP